MGRPATGRRRLAARLAVFLTTGLVLLVTPGLVVAAQSWSISTSEVSVESGTPTDVTITVTNTSGNNGGGESIGCVRVSIPVEFSVGSTSVTSVSRGFSWGVSTSGSGPTVVEARALDDNNRLRGDPEFDVLVLKVNVTGGPVGSYVWTADEYEKPDCSQNHNDTRYLPMAVNDGVNDPPIAVDDAASGAHDRDLVVAAPGVLANDTDPENDPMSATLASGPSNGSVSLASDGSYTYTPNTAFVGTDSFTYQASDGAQISASATVTLTVTNAVPIPADDAWAVEKNVAQVVAAPGVLANDGDADGDALTAVLQTGPTNGSLSLAANGSFTYTPNSGYTGPDSFTYEVTDGIATATATVTLTVSNKAPVAVDDGYAAAKNLPLIVLSGAGVLANDSDPNGDALSASLVSGPSSGTLLLGAGGGFTYTPNLGFTGTDSFVYSASDGGQASSATVTIAVANDAPVGAPDAGSVVHDRSLAVGTPGVLVNDTDANGDALTASLVTAAANGTVLLAADGSYTYTPNAGFVGADSFEYAATDGAASTAPVLVSITITNVAPAPVADTASTKKNVALGAAAPGVLGNDVDTDGDSLAATLVAGPSNGTLSLSVDGSYTYTPDPGFVGTDAFTYAASDGAASVSSTLTVDVTNTAPIAADDNATTTHGRALTVPAPGVLANDVDPDGDALVASLASPPTGGIVVLAPDGSVVYTPNPGFVGTDSFTYAASDGLASAAASVTIDVTNVGPVAVDDLATTDEGVALIVPAPGVLANDADADGDDLRAVVSTAPSHGSVVLVPDGSFMYTPDPGFVGVDTFTYRAGDGPSSSAPATVRITVVGAPTPTPSPTPGASPTPGPGPATSPTPSPEPTPTSDPEPTTSPEPPPTSSPAPSATPEPTTTGRPDVFIVPSGDGPGGGGPQAIDVELAAAGLGSLGAFMWLVPGMALSVPGLLVVLAIAAQAFGGLAWLPLVWRKVGALGSGRRRRRQPPRA